jgi:hypothetical protein
MGRATLGEADGGTSITLSTLLGGSLGGPVVLIIQGSGGGSGDIGVAIPADTLLYVNDGVRRRQHQSSSTLVLT